MRLWRRWMREPARRGAPGFTLIEVLIVVAIVGILATVAVVQLKNTPQRAKEAVLRENLFVMRDVIDQYFADKGKYPESLNTLVEEGYLRKIPVDPITESDRTWLEIIAESDEDNVEGGTGIADVQSGATGTALDGTAYAEW